MKAVYPQLCRVQGHGKDFLKEGEKGMTLCQAEGVHKFLPPEYCRLISLKGLQRGKGGSQVPRTPPSYPFGKEWLDP